MFAQQFNPMMPNYMYNGMAPQQIQKFNNFLTDEEIKSLQAKKDDFNIAPTNTEIAKARCNHRSQDGTSDTLTVDPLTGKVRCSICGYEFLPLDADTSIDAIKESTSKLLDILQTIKLLFWDFPVDAAREFFQIIPYIEKIPRLYEYAANNFAKHDNPAYWSLANKNIGTIQQFQNLQNLFAGGMMFQQPMYQQQPMQPQFAPQAPAGYPQAAYAPQPNPFGGFAQPTVAYQPMTSGFQYNAQPTAPEVQPTVVAPQAPVTADTTVKQQVTL